MSNSETQWGILLNDYTSPCDSRAEAQEWIDLHGEGELVSREVTYGDWLTEEEFSQTQCHCYRCKNSLFERFREDSSFNTPSNWLPMQLFIVCDQCGNKRCPRATWHEYNCTHSNEPGQEGSRYE